MAAEIPITPKTLPATPTPGNASKGTPGRKKTPGKWFQKIPREILFSPGGFVLIFFALIVEIVDLIPLPVVDNLWELPLELGLIAMIVIIGKVSLASLLIPFIIERIPGLNDIVPSFFVKLFL